MPAPPFIRPLREDEVGRTLASKLVPIADRIRQLATRFGVRPYRVFLVWLSYSRDEAQSRVITADELQIDDLTVGAGGVTLLQEVEILPTPRVQGISSVRKEVESTGTTEDGDVEVDRISRSYSEDALTGLLPQYRQLSFPETLKPGIAFFWEIREDRPRLFQIQNTGGVDFPTDARAYHRRFVPVGPPALRAVQWRITLTRADGEKGRNNELVNEVLP